MSDPLGEPGENKQRILVPGLSSFTPDLCRQTSFHWPVRASPQSFVRGQWMPTAPPRKGAIRDVQDKLLRREDSRRPNWETQKWHGRGSCPKTLAENSD